MSRSAELSKYLGLLFVVLAIVSAVHQVVFFAGADNAVATVVGVEKRNDTCGGKNSGRYPCTIFTAHFQFETPDGEKVRFQRGGGQVRGHNLPDQYSHPHPGQQFWVLYDPARPEINEINNWAHRWAASVFCAVIGLLCLVIGYFRW